jgi:hypothetical protein
MKTKKRVYELSRQFGLTATLLREKKHLCFSLSNGKKSGLLVVSKSPSDYLDERNMVCNIRQIARSVNEQNLH